MKNKCVVVTGGLGFIGSHLVEELCYSNHVIIIDNQSSGTLDNISHLNQDNLTIKIGDINNLDLKQIFNGVDYVFHQAALASVPLSIDNPKLCNLVNVDGTLKILDAATEASVKKVVFASSSSVYGDTDELPLSEKVTLNPKSPYAASKAAGELYCQAYTESYGLPTISLRYFNVFGPRQDPNSHYAAVIPKFIDSLSRGTSPSIHGDGEQTRDFIYVKDVVRANIFLCQSSSTKVFNIASGLSLSVNQLLKVLQEIIGVESDICYEPERLGDVKHSLADISRLKKTGFKLKYSFEEALIRTLKVN